MGEIFKTPNIDSLYTEAEDGMKATGYIALIAPLVKSVQELTEEVNKLKEELNK